MRGSKFTCSKWVDSLLENKASALTLTLMRKTNIKKQSRDRDRTIRMFLSPFRQKYLFFADATVLADEATTGICVGQERWENMCCGSGQERWEYMCWGSGQEKWEYVCYGSGQERWEYMCCGSGQERWEYMCCRSGQERWEYMCRGSGQEKWEYMCCRSGQERWEYVCCGSGQERWEYMCCGSGQERWEYVERYRNICGSGKVLVKVDMDRLNSPKVKQKQQIKQMNMFRAVLWLRLQ